MNNLRKIRRAEDITQEQLAKATGSTKSYICDLEREMIRNPSLGKARLIAMALNSTLDKVFPESKVKTRVRLSKAEQERIDYDSQG